MIYKVGIEPGDAGTEVFVSVETADGGHEIATIDVIQKPEDNDFPYVMEGVLSKLVADSILDHFTKREE